MLDNSEYITPYLTIVIPFRNDNYTLNNIEKFNFSLNVLIKQFENFKIPLEVIIVDWNSPNPQKPLINEILLEGKSEYVSVIIFEVENSIHRKYKGSENRNLVGEAAFNIGIRRSKGHFVVGKVSDTFYSNSLINFLAEKKLNPNSVYRVDRVDIKSDYPIPQDWERHFKDNILVRKSANDNEIHTKACGDFLLMSRKIWFCIKGFPETNSVVHHGADGEALYAALGLGANQEYLKNDMCLYKISHPNMHAARMHNDNSFELSYLNNSIPNKKIKKFANFLIIFIKFLLGVLNLPKTKISGVRTRSVYRYFLIANFRKLFFGGSFIKNNNWGYPENNFKRKIINKAIWEK